MNHTLMPLRRAFAACLVVALAGCFWKAKPGATGPVAPGPNGTSGAAPVKTPVTAKVPAPGALRAPAREVPRDPAAPIAASEYVTTAAERRQSLNDRGLRLAPAEVGYYMDVQEARLRQLGGRTLRLTRIAQSLVIELPGPLNFEVGSARLSASARAALTGVARVLVDYRFTIISVDGYTDDSGDPATNRALSEQRASAVAKHLVSEGVEPTRFLVVGRGAERPIGDNATEVGREANRRVVLRIDPLQR